MKTFPVLSVVLFITLQETFAQIADDFSDGTLHDNPDWTGTIDDFVVNDARELQLNALLAGTSWLSTDFRFDSAAQTEWEVMVRESFSPSGSNFGRFYLMSDQPDLSGNLNGYFLQFGEAGSNDAIELFRQSGSQYKSICRATPAGIATAFEVRVKVRRDDQGKWQLFADYSGGTEFTLEASGSDDMVKVSHFCGLLFTYTITNAAKIYVDDLLVRTTYPPDQTGPKALAVEVSSSSTLIVSFSEALDGSAEDTENYNVLPLPGKPLTATRGNDGRLVNLRFQDPFLNGAESLLQIENINDTSGNTMLPAEIRFVHFSEEPVFFRDIIFTELFPDPSPPRELPEAEFIELYNRSSNPVSISGWTVSDETTSGQIPPFILQANKYLILTSIKAAPMFQAFGDVLGMITFPSLNNSGDILVLKNDEGLTIDSLEYAASWYRDNEKADGGWSLELIDPHNVCAEAENWISSDATGGGSPGAQNSVYAEMPDNTGPLLTSVVVVDSITLALWFDEKLDVRLPSRGEFTVMPPLEIVAIGFGDPGRRSLLVTLSDPVLDGQTYMLSLGNIYDCPGNRIRPDHSEASFVLPQRAEAGDIIVNEILFNPRPTGVDFVEVHNRSSKVIDLKGCRVRNFNGDTSPAIATNLLIYPGAYRVFSGDGNRLKGEYLSGKEETFYNVNLPSLNDDEGSVALLGPGNLLMDSVFYNDDMHSPFVRDREGISLERISSSGNVTDISNWRSASSTAGFATPGYTNSNSRNGLPVDEGSVTIVPEVIKSDRSQPDFAQINYHFRNGGMSANVMVFDHQGRPIKSIAENELLGTEGFFRWDGDRDFGGFAATGYYLVWFEVFDARGRVKTFRKRVAIF